MLENIRNKKVFITGHTGFKGIWLSLLLKELGAKIYGYALAPVNNPIYNDIESTVFENSCYADIRDGVKLKASVLSAMPDIIFHLAAQPLVIDSYADPSYTFDVNVMGTTQLLDALRDYPKNCAVIVITTDKVYENNEWVYPYRENDRLGGHDPYSASKACAELVIQSFRKSFFAAQKSNKNSVALASVRAGNVIGGGDWSANRIIPDIIRAFHAGSVLEVRNPMAVRPWQHVLDALYGYLILTERLVTDNTNPLWSSAWNFGPVSTDNLSVGEITTMATKEWEGGQYVYKQTEKDAIHEAGLLRLDCSRAQQLLSWNPVWNAPLAIATTIDWYKKVLLHNQRPSLVALEQIRQFLSEVKA